MAGSGTSDAAVASGDGDVVGVAAGASVAAVVASVAAAVTGASATTFGAGSLAAGSVRVLSSTFGALKKILSPQHQTLLVHYKISTRIYSTLVLVLDEIVVSSSEDLPSRTFLLPFFPSSRFGVRRDLLLP